MAGFGKPAPEKKKGTKSGTEKAQAATGKEASNTGRSAAGPSTAKGGATLADIKSIVDSVDDSKDPFWQLLPHILASEFPPNELDRVLGFIRYSTGEQQLPRDIVEDPWRPHEDIHAFMVCMCSLLHVCVYV
jgi:hypothetical protein